jgi:hypothetical protein
MRPLHQQVARAQGRLPGGVPAGGVRAHGGRGRQADRDQRRPAPRPRQHHAHRDAGKPERRRLAEQRPPRVGGDQLTQRHADRRPLGQQYGGEPEHRQGQRRPEQGPGCGREAAVEDQEAGGGRPDQQRKPPIQRPAASQRQRRRSRRGGGRGRLRRRRCDPGVSADAEPESAAGDVAVHPGDRSPAHRVGAVGQLTEGRLELQRPAGHRGGAAGLDRPAAGVQHLDAGQRRVGRLGEGKQHHP